MMNWAEVRAINSDLTKPLNETLNEGIASLQEVVDDITIDEHHFGNYKGKVINNYVHDPYVEWETPRWFGNILGTNATTGSVTGRNRIAPVIHDNEVYLFDYQYESEFSLGDDYTFIHVYKYNGRDQFELLRAYQPLSSNLNNSLGFIVQVNNDDVYLLQTSSANTGTTYFYKFDWDRFGFYTSLTTPPISCYNVQFTIFNGELHLMASGSSENSYADNKKHYKWNGSSWVQVSTLPITTAASPTFLMVQYKNNLYLLGGNTVEGALSSQRAVYKFIPGETAAASTWELQPEMQFPSAFSGWNKVWIEYNDKLYILGQSSSYKPYTWNGESWGYDTDFYCYTTESNNGQTYLNGNNVYPFIFNNVLYLFNIYNNHTNYNRIATFDGEKFTFHLEKIELEGRELKIAGQDKTILMENAESGVKSVQTGFITNSTTSWQEIYITPVNPNKSVIYISPVQMSNGNYYHRFFITGDRLHYMNSYTSSVQFQWTIIEFY